MCGFMFMLNVLPLLQHRIVHFLHVCWWLRCLICWYADWMHEFNFFCGNEFQEKCTSFNYAHFMVSFAFCAQQKKFSRGFSAFCVHPKIKISIFAQNGDFPARWLFLKKSSEIYNRCWQRGGVECWEQQKIIFVILLNLKIPRSKVNLRFFKAMPQTLKVPNDIKSFLFSLSLPFFSAYASINIAKRFCAKKKMKFFFFRSPYCTFSQHTHDGLYQIVLISSSVASKWNEQKPPREV